jgi:exopolysaccharide production protein ExoQ
MIRTITIPLTKIETFFAVSGLLFFSDPIALYFAIGDAFLGGRNTRTFLFPLVVFCSLLFLAIRWKRVFSIIKRNRFILIPIVILMLIVFLSLLWSVAPQTTLKRSVFFSAATLFSIYFTTRFDPEKQVSLLAWALGIAAILSVFFIVFLPTYGQMGGREILVGGNEAELSGAFRGVFIHKNALGRAMALACSALLCVAIDNRNKVQGWLAWAGFFLAFALVVACQSATSLFVTISCLVLIPLYRNLRWNIQMVSLYSIILIVIGSFIVLGLSNFDTVATALGRDATLTGRTDLWNAVLYDIAQKPILGYGYRAYWRGWEGPSATIWELFPWLPPHSHNGFLDLWLELGLLGLLTFLASFVLFFLRALVWVRSTSSMCGLFPIVFLNFLLLTNLTESSLLRENIYWLFYLSSFSLSSSKT